MCSPRVMRIVREKLGLQETPMAVQARLGGAKGMWFVDPSFDLYSEEVSITITKSQLKFKSHDSDHEPDTMDWARLTLFVLRCPKEPLPGYLNLEFIPILAHQGVPYQVFKRLLEAHLDEDLQKLLAAASDRISLRIWLSQNGVMSDRHKNSGVAQQISGLPESEQEQINMMLDARFEPLKCSFLKDKLERIIKERCRVILNGLHIRVPSSTFVYCIADPTGTLNEGEVSLQFSKGFVDLSIETRLDCIEDDVLVARNPAHVPSDIQKVCFCPPTLYTHMGSPTMTDISSLGQEEAIPVKQYRCPSGPMQQDRYN